MNDRAAIWRAAAAHADSGAPAAMATVARRRGSLPMASDAKMLVARAGRREGTVGGGCVEADVIAQALGITAPAVVRHTLNHDLAGDLGLSCGGTVDLFLEPVVPAAGPVYRAVADALDGRVPGAVSTAIHWQDGPRKAAWIGARCIAVGSWAPSRPPLGPGALAGEVFHELVPRAPRLLLFGAGHVAQAIARVAAGTDFHVVVADDRADFANAERFPDAQHVIVADLRAALDGLDLDEDDYVIACTRGHAMDALVVERTAGSAARYVGMLGSRRKRAVIWQALARAGVAEDQLRRVKVPIGAEIGADTPAEIGVAVMAELIRLRRRPRPS